VGYKPTVTEPERPAVGPTGSPTPEEISARLEALLKRTHALRAQREPAGPGGPLHVTWPPTDGELERYDVVDVPEDHRTTAPVAAAAGEPGPVEARPAVTEGPDFSRPDWSELRLRGGADEPPTRSPWLVVLASVLALVALGEAAYIWHLRTTTPAQAGGQLRIDGPAGAAVRLDGRDFGAAPVDEPLAPGVYDIELEDQGTVFRAEDVSVGLGRTVVLLTPTPVQAPATPAADAAAPTTPAPGTAAAATGAAAVSDTTGAVAIESTPSGLPVTMGGRPRGVTPLTLGQIRPGRHDVLVGGLARQVDIEAGQVTTLRVIR
jgi:hypothetical protein